MLKSPKVLTINSSFPEIEHLSAGLAEAGLLSCHIRPYVNKGRIWERVFKVASLRSHAYNRTIGRRKLVNGLPSNRVRENGIPIDICMALAARMPIDTKLNQLIGFTLSQALTKSIANAGVKALNNENTVVASWNVAEMAFQKNKTRGGLNILNYSFAHHSFAKEFLSTEAELEPAFADTLEICDWPKRLIDRLDEEIELADKILVGSSFVKNTFLAQHVDNDKLEVLPYGVDTNFFAPSLFPDISNNRFRVLFVGQIGQRKGISYLLRSYKRFRGPGTSLTLVGRLQGDKSMFAPWRNIFKHIPHCPKSNLPKIYHENDVFLFPTLLEGMGLVVLEAMACGLPVITTLNGPGDLIRDGVDGFIVPPRDVDAIEDCLEKLRSDYEFRIWIGRNARNRALQFSWECYRKRAVEYIQIWHKDKLI